MVARPPARALGALSLVSPPLSRRSVAVCAAKDAKKDGKKDKATKDKKAPEPQPEAQPEGEGEVRIQLRVLALKLNSAALAPARFLTSSRLAA